MMNFVKCTTASLLAAAFSATAHAQLSEPAIVTTDIVNIGDPDTSTAAFVQGAVYSNGTFKVLWASGSGSEIVEVNVLGTSPVGDVSSVMSIADWAAGTGGAFASTGNFLGQFASGTYVFPTLGDDAVFGFSGSVTEIADEAAVDAATGDSTSFLQYSAYNAGSDLYYFINGDSTPGEGGIFSVTEAGVITEEAGDGAVTAALPALPDFDIEGLAVTGPAGGETFYFASNDNDAIYAYDNATDTASLLFDAALSSLGSVGFSSGFTLGGDGLLYFYDVSSDSIYSIDPSAVDVEASLDVTISEGDIISIAGADAVGQLIWTDIAGGTLAFTQTSGAGVQGVYLVPEPASLALVALGGGVCLMRRRTA